LHRKQLWQNKLIFRKCNTTLMHLKYWCLKHSLMKERSCEFSWLSLSYILNSIKLSSSLRWTRVCLSHSFSKMQHSIELISSCTCFLTRHLTRKMWIENSYLTTMKSSKKNFNEFSKYLTKSEQQNNVFMFCDRINQWLSI